MIVRNHCRCFNVEVACEDGEGRVATYQRHQGRGAALLPTHQSIFSVRT